MGGMLHRYWLAHKQQCKSREKDSETLVCFLSELHHRNAPTSVGLKVLAPKTSRERAVFAFCILLYLYPGFYSYTEGATWKILALIKETLLI